MNAPTSSAAAEKSLPVDSDVGAEMSKLVEEHPWMTTVKTVPRNWNQFAKSPPAFFGRQRSLGYEIPSDDTAV
jgi:hypothetical protein